MVLSRHRSPLSVLAPGRGVKRFAQVAQGVPVAPPRPPLPLPGHRADCGAGAGGRRGPSRGAPGVWRTDEREVGPGKTGRCVRCPGAERGAAPAPRGALRPGVRAGSSRPWFALARTGGLRNADAEPRRRKGPVATEAAAGAMPPQVRAPGATGSWLGRGGPLPGASGGSTALPAPRRCRSGLPSSERINSSSVSRQLRGTSAPTVRRAPCPRGSSRPSTPTWSSLRASDAVLGAARGPTDPAPRFPGQRVSAPWQAG